MTLVVEQPRNVDVPPPILMKRWTVDEYHVLIRASIFARDDRFELLEGWIVPKMPRNPPHDVSVDKAQEPLRNRVGNNWRVRIQSAITLSDSEPEPDIVVVPGPPERYLEGHPGPRDIHLVAEIAESSRLDDRRRKLRIYARAGLVQYWIVNLVDSLIEVYTDHTGASGAPQYRLHHDYKIGEPVPLMVAGHTLAPIPVTDLLP